MLRLRGHARPIAERCTSARTAFRGAPARHRATHKDLPDPPKKDQKRSMRPEPEKLDLDPEHLKRLVESITPKEAELLRELNDPFYKKKATTRDIPSQPEPLWKLLLKHVGESKKNSGTEPVGATLDWSAARKPFDNPMGFTTLISILLLYVIWLFYTRDFESDIAQIIGDLNVNPSPEAQATLLERLFYSTMGFSQQIRRMVAPQSETLEEVGAVGAFAKAIAGGDEDTNAWGYAGIAAFLCSTPEAVPLPRLGRVIKSLTTSVIRDVVKESHLQRDIDVNLWRTFFAFAHHYEFARSVPTEVLVYIATRLGTLADSTALNPVEREQFHLLRKIIVPLSSNERAERFFKSQANDSFQSEYEKIKRQFPIAIALQPVRQVYSFIEEAGLAVTGAMLWSGLRASRLSPKANTIGVRPMWRLSRPHFSSLVNASLWSATGALAFLIARTEATPWPDKVVGTVRSKITGEPYMETKRINYYLAPSAPLIGAITATLVANIPHATGVVVCLSAYDMWKGRYVAHLSQKNGLRTEMFKQVEKAKNDAKSWLVDKVYGSGPRY